MTATWTSSLRHIAHFYRDEAVLHRTIAEFFADGARQGDSLVMISRAGTFEAVLGRLNRAPNPVVDRDGILFIDAANALAQFMDTDRPDPARFQQGIAGILTGVRSGSKRMVRMFGEMVDVLCGDGNHAGTVCLEELWNGIASEHAPVAVLCGYDIRNFQNDPNAVRYHAICNLHSLIIPVEGVAGYSDSDRSEQTSPAEGISNGTIPILKAEPLRNERFRSAESTIYIIEDDDSVRRSLARLLGSMNLKVRTFGSAEEFLSQVGESSNGCIIVDVQLVGMSGSELQSRLVESGCSLPVIAMSGSHDPHIEINSLRLGAKAFLCKPFDLRRLLDAIDQAMA